MLSWWETFLDELCGIQGRTNHHDDCSSNKINNEDHDFQEIQLFGENDDTIRKPQNDYYRHGQQQQQEQLSTEGEEDALVALGLLVQPSSQPHGKPTETIETTRSIPTCIHTYRSSCWLLEDELLTPCSDDYFAFPSLSSDDDVSENNDDNHHLPATISLSDNASRCQSTSRCSSSWRMASDTYLDTDDNLVLHDYYHHQVVPSALFVDEEFKDDDTWNSLLVLE